MIQKLRRKFIVITMLSVVIVIYSIIGIINIFNYVDIANRVDPFMNSLISTGGEKPLKEGMDKPFNPGEGGFFSVVVNYDGEIISANTSNISYVSEADINSYGEIAYKKMRSEGFIDSFRYKAVSRDNSTLIVFLDCSRELATFNSFLVSSLVISTIGVFLVFILVVFLSRIIVKPIARSYEKQKRFITDASHEIKTPLTIIGANVEILEMDVGENEWISGIKGQIKRLIGLSNSLVTLSKMDEGGDHLRDIPFSLSDLLVSNAKPFVSLAKKEDKSLVLEIEDNIEFIGEEELFRQLENIFLENAFKYSNKNGEITFKLEKINRSLELSCYNTLDEIKEGNLDFLFERFYRGDESRSSKVSGYGLGLSIAREIVNRYKGKIKATSSDGKSFLIKAIFKI